MGAWAECDFSQFKKLADNFSRAEQEKLIAKFSEEVLLELANRLLRLTKKNTPKDTGQLKRNWFVSGVKRKGEYFEVTVFNNTEYASFVENGHRQEVGKYVPAIGKRLVEPWVEGSHMLRISMQEIEKIMPKLIGKRYQEFLKKLMEV